MNANIDLMNVWGAQFAGFAMPMLVQSSVLIALLFALDLALRKRVRATIRYAVWLLALVKLALPPSLALPTGAAYWLPAKTAAIYVAPTAAPAAVAEEMTAATVHMTDPLVKVSPTLTLQAVLFSVWLVVAVVMAFWVVWRLRMVLRLIRQSADAPEAVRGLLESCRQQSGINRFMQVRCAAIGSPAICGIFRPVILIPHTLAENLRAAEMRPVLLHELAHFKRGDLWVNHAQIFLQILFWCHPLLWLANANIRWAREQAADEMVLVEMGEEAPSYPATLLLVAKLGLGRPVAALGLMGILEPGRALQRRILHIMNRPMPRTARLGARGLAALLLLALVALPMAGRTKEEPALPKDTTGTAQNDLTVAISSDGALALQMVPLTMEDLGKKLTEASREKTHVKLTIQADKTAPWEVVVKVLDAARALNINVTTAAVVTTVNKVRGHVYVEGQVHTQGCVDLLFDEKLTAGQAILKAGGFLDFANKTRIKISRNPSPGGTNQIILVNMADVLERGETEKDVVLEPGDLVFVPLRAVNF